MSSRPLVATLGSHSALQILKGARDEGLPNLVIGARGSEALYRRYPFVDEVVAVPRYDDFVSLEDDLLARGAVVVPHGSFVAYLGREFASPDEVDAWPVMVKTHGAAGGSGYVLARSRDALEAHLARLGPVPVAIQHYVIGVTLYVHYFQSIIDDRLEILSMDRRYETDVDALGRLPFAVQQAIEPTPSYVVVGNSPLVLRESMLETAYRMGEQVVAASRALIDPRGMWGPFCLETIITPDMAFHVIEISCRIVAGTNLFVNGSPYAAMWFDEPMSTGRRIARELRLAAEQGRLADVVDAARPKEGGDP